MALHQSFEERVQNYESYPANLLRPRHPSYVVETVQEQLKDHDDGTLYCKGDFSIPVLDLGVGRNSEHQYKTIESMPDLDSQLQIGMAAGSSEKDMPSCRFIFLHASSSREPLQVNREPLLKILSRYQVMPEFVDFLCKFTVPQKSRHARFSSFASQSHLSREFIAGLSPAEQGLFRRRYQFTYNLRSVVRLDKANARPDWEIQQNVMHHQFDIDTGRALWINLAHGQNLQDVVAETMRGDMQREILSSSISVRFNESLDVCIITCRSTFAQWRPYVGSLLDRLDDVCGSRDAPKYVVLDENGGEDIFKGFPGIKTLQCDVAGARAALESNSDIVSSLVQFYKEMASNPRQVPGSTTDIHVQHWEPLIDDFASAIAPLKSELQRTLKVVNDLYAETEDILEMIIKQVEIQSSKRLERQGKFVQAVSSAVLVVSVLQFCFIVIIAVATVLSAVTTVQPCDDKKGGSVCFRLSRGALIAWLAISCPGTLALLDLALYLYQNPAWLTDMRMISWTRVMKGLKLKLGFNGNPIASSHDRGPGSNSGGITRTGADLV